MSLTNGTSRVEMAVRTRMRDHYSAVTEESRRPFTSPPPTSPMTEDHVWFEDRWMVASLCDE
jgi:hypothetical protein